MLCGAERKERGEEIVFCGLQSNETPQKMRVCTRARAHRDENPPAPLRSYIILLDYINSIDIYTHTYTGCYKSTGTAE